MGKKLKQWIAFVVLLPLVLVSVIGALVLMTLVDWLTPPRKRAAVGALLLLALLIVAAIFRLRY